jgi:Protease inhibitor Inh
MVWKGMMIGAFVVLAGGPGTAEAATELLPATADAVATVAGAWEIATPTGNARCRVQLSVQKTRRETKQIFGFPVACRQSMPALGRVEGWGLATNGSIVLTGAKGAELGTFTRVGDAEALKGAIGRDAFAMTPVSGRYPSAERLASVSAAVNRLAQPDVDDPRTPMRVAGSYQLFRVEGQPAIACTLVLDRRLPGPPSAPGSGKASLGNGCADRGLMTFDPVGWIMERDRLFLIAKKGHRQGFNLERDGRLVKDPPAGSPLSARKIATPAS